jgi:hypothetical protein
VWVFATREARQCGHNTFKLKPVITKAAASNFQSGSGSANNHAEAPMPNTGTNNAMGVMTEAGCLANNQPHAA